jgi:hypothetical protein
MERARRGRGKAGQSFTMPGCRRDHGEEMVAQIGCSYNVSGGTIARLNA